MRDGHVYLACLGQFKRGKSTLINAILGQAVLPAGVTPVTSVVTVVQYGDGDGADIHLLDGTSLTISRDELSDFVTERHHADLVGVAMTEVWARAALWLALALALALVADATCERLLHSAMLAAAR
jgi:hypothetical protein